MLFFILNIDKGQFLGWFSLRSLRVLSSALSAVSVFLTAGNRRVRKETAPPCESPYFVGPAEHAERKLNKTDTS